MIRQKYLLFNGGGIANVEASDKEMMLIMKSGAKEISKTEYQMRLKKINSDRAPLTREQDTGECNWEDAYGS